MDSGTPTRNLLIYQAMFIPFRINNLALVARNLLILLMIMLCTSFENYGTIYLMDSLMNMNMNHEGETLWMI